ncbi:hypothetical protein LCGC14_0834640 [marine sediment metagenome]|uniref:LamG-like jellyroll fold domain-containing protein n=1 Tax=marine sediment metagenome TaxID=412755 RepID=A0A0F9RZL6_9ZZZZ
MSSRRNIEQKRAEGLVGRDWGILNEIRAILGTTKAHMWPCLEATGAVVTGFAATDLVPSDELGSVNLEDEFIPVLAGRSEGFRAYHYTGDNNRHLLAGDSAEYSFEGDGSTPNSDDAFSVAAWVFPTETASAYQTIMAKYDEGVATEWTFGLNASDELALQLFDGIDGASGHVTGTSVFTAVRHRMGFYVATYSGTGDEAGINLYKDGIIEAAPVQITTGSYVSMDDTAATLMLGGRDDGGVPDDLMEGWQMLPMLTGKVLDEDEVETLYQLSRVLVGA